MNATQIEARATYIQDIQKHIRVDEDQHKNIVCDVPSTSNPEGLEDGAWHRVHVDPKTTVPSPYHCSCEGFQYTRRTCVHMTVVVTYYARLYKSTIEKMKAKMVAKIAAEVDATKAETAKHNTPEELNAACKKLREMKSVKVGQPGSVALAGKSKSNWDTTAPLNGTRAFNMYR